MNRILVTGGAGFLGSHPCDHLLKNGHDLLAIGNFVTGNKGNVSHRFSNPYFERTRRSLLCDPATL